MIKLIVTNLIWSKGSRLSFQSLFYTNVYKLFQHLASYKHLNFKCSIFYFNSGMICIPDAALKQFAWHDKLFYSVMPSILSLIWIIMYWQKVLTNQLLMREDQTAIKAFDLTLRDLLSLWFTVGLLSLQRITWDSPCDMLQKVRYYIHFNPSYECGIHLKISSLN